MRRVVITGIGVITALGSNAATTWEALRAGRTGIGPIKDFDASSLRMPFAAQIADFDPRELLDRRTARKMTRDDQLAAGAATLAIRDAGLDGGLDPDRTGLFVGGGKEVSDLTKLVDAITGCTDNGRFDVRLVGENISAFQPLFYVEGLQSSSLFYISSMHNIKGENTYFAGTSEASMCAIGRAFRAVRCGEADRAIAGGSDDPVWWWAMSSFDSLGVLTERGDLGAQAFRPFDRDGSGSVLGEGAAFVVVEEYEAAKRRGAIAHAEISGYGCAADAYRLVTPHPDGAGLVRALRRALEDARWEPDTVGFVAAHGSATSLGDLSEARALRTVFDGSSPVASAVKPATGHLVGGAGALNTAVAAMAVRDKVVPPTLNHDVTRPGCEFKWATGTARDVPMTRSVAIARGLEGQNCVLALRSV